MIQVAGTRTCLGAKQTACGWVWTIRKAALDPQLGSSEFSWDFASQFQFECLYSISYNLSEYLNPIYKSEHVLAIELKKYI